MKSFNQYLPITLFILGMISFITGLCFIYYDGVRVSYRDIIVSIPLYKFETLWPGNYVSTVSIPLNMIYVKYGEVSRTTNYVYTVNIPWSNCSGGDFIGIALSGRKLLRNTSLDIIVEVYGCDDECTLILSQNIPRVEGGCVADEYGLFSCKTEFKVLENFLKYKYLNFSLIPAQGLVIDEFLTGSVISCTFNYTIPYPTLKLRDVEVQPYILNIPYYDFTGLRNGLILSLTGLLLILVSVYVKIVMASNSKLELT
jgi:hypothetical protein